MDEIKDALASNVTKLVERDGKISDLSARAERLETESEMFQVMTHDSDLLSGVTLLSFVQKTARKLKQKEMMKNIKIPLLLLSISVVLVIITVLVLSLSAQ